MMYKPFVESSKTELLLWHHNTPPHFIGFISYINHYMKCDECNFLYPYTPNNIVYFFVLTFYMKNLPCIRLLS